MDEENIQTKTVAVSKTKMAVAIGLLGLSALAAGFSGLRYGRFKPDLTFAHSSSNGNDLTQLNQFSITFQNAGNASITSPFVLNIKLGYGTADVVKSIKVLNPVSDRIRGSYEILESDTGSFDVLVRNYNLDRGQTDTITFWFVIPSDYNSDKLPVEYTVDPTNTVSEADETNNRYKQKFDIAQSGLIQEAPPEFVRVVTALEDDGSSITTNDPEFSDVAGAFVFTSPGHTSVLKSITVQLEGTLIAPESGDDTVKISLYDAGTTNTFIPDADHLMATSTISNVDTYTSTPVKMWLSNNNVFTQAKTVYVVVDTIDSDFHDTSGESEVLRSSILGFTWSDDGENASEHEGIHDLPSYSTIYEY